MLVFLFFFKDPYLYILFHSTTLHRAVFYHKNTFFVNFPLAAYADSRLTRFGTKPVSTHISVWSDLISVQTNTYWPLSESAEGVCVWFALACISLMCD